MGCHRSIDEIVAWSAADDEERGRILGRARARARQPPAMSRRGTPLNVCTTHPGGTPAA